MPSGVTSSGRIDGYDFARAWAVFGMVLVNYRLVMSGEGEAGWLAAAVGMLEGRAAALFVVLAGVGLSLASNKARSEGNRAALRISRQRLWKRSFLLLVVGLAYTPVWPADILHFYAFYIALGACLLAVRDRILLVVAGGLVAAFVLLLLLFDYEQGWDFEAVTYLDLWTVEGMVRHIFYNGFHPVVPWAAFLLLGMWLGRQPVSEVAVRRRLLWIAGGVWLAVELVSNGAMSYFTEHPHGMTPEDIAALMDTKPMPPMPQYMLSAGASAVVMIVLSVGFCLRWGEVRGVRLLRRTGQLSLTLYVAHVVLGMGVLEALGLLEGQSVAFAVGAALCFCLLGMVFAGLWLRHFKAGPLEALFRKLT